MAKNIALLFFLFITCSLFAQETTTVDPKDVTIVRDQWGVPHIYGKTDADAIYGMVWAHAEDNFELMQHSWAATRMRAGEILGKDGAIFDVLCFLTESDRIFDEEYEEAFSDDFKGLIRAFTQGANDYARTHPEEVLLKDLFPITEKDVVTGYILGNMLMTGTAFDVGKIFGNTIHRFEKHQTQPTGSNGFAISRKITKEQETFFCSNSHQPLEGIVAWYECHVNSEEGWNMLGATFTLGMTPFVGTNPHLGWTHTVNHPDLTDVYKLKMHPKKKHYYQYDGKWEKLEVKKLKMKVKVIGIKFPITMKFYKSKHGMVMKNKKGYYALRFSANKHIAAAEQWFKMNKATSFAEFHEALRMQQIPCFNVVYADKEDNIYNICNALIPDNRQGDFNWSGVMRGDTSANVWEPSFYKVKDLPQLHNPDCGWIFNSNNTPFTATEEECDMDKGCFPNKYMGFLTKETNRSIRFKELMRKHGNKKLSYSDFKRMKFDIQYADSTFYTYNIENLDDITRLDPEKYPDLADVLAMLNDWDRSTDKNDPRVAVFSVAFTYIIDELSERSTILEANVLPEEVFVKALRKGKRFIKRHYGTIEVPFGEVHRHKRAEDSDVSYPMEGLPENLAAMAYKRDKKGKLRTYSGESFILISKYNKDGLASVETINAFGASNRPDSPHYTDQMEMFVNKKMKKMTLDKKQIFKNAARVYSPKPAPKP